MYNLVNVDIPLKFEWDPAKAQSNLMKHGVGFELAVRVWDDPLHIVLSDRFEGGEHRWHAVGLVGEVVLLVVVHTCPDADDEERIRIIGPRKATRQERTRYEQEAS
jgi:uncharacterized DUF497 family protein